MVLPPLVPRSGRVGSDGSQDEGHHGFNGVSGVDSTFRNGEARKYVTQACEACRSRRSKCDGGLPTCLPCTKRCTSCSYSDVDRRRGKMKKHEVDALQSQVKDLSKVLAILKLSSDEEAIELLRKLRSGPVETPRPGSTGAELTANLLRSQNRDIPFRVESTTPIVEFYTRKHLPPEDLIKVGMDGYFKCGYTLFYIFERTDVQALLDRVYRSCEPVDDATLCELCALAGIGSHYEADKIPDAFMEALFRTASLNLNACIEDNYLRAMRVLLCLSMYAFMAKRNSARVSIATGLQLARWARLHKQVPTRSWEGWRRVYRTLVFMECWLSATLGYQADLSEEEVEFTRQPIEEIKPTIENEIQRQMCLAGLLKANVLNDVYRLHPAVFSIVKKHSRILDEWESSLDPSMRLEALAAENYTGYIEQHRRSLMLVHLLSLGTRILLQRRLMVAMAECRINQRWSLDGTLEEGQQIQQECVQSAHAIVNLLDIMGYTRNMFKRCWMCIGHAFSASSVLLFEVSQRLLYDIRVGIKEGLADSQECIDMLEACSSADRVAMSMLNILLPLHQELNRLASRDRSPQQSDIYDLLQNPHPDASPSEQDLLEKQASETSYRAEVIPAMQKAIEVLGNPFGHERRLSIDSLAPGDTTVPTWWN